MSDETMTARRAAEPRAAQGRLRRIRIPGIYRAAEPDGARGQALAALSGTLGNTPLRPVALTVDGVERTVWLKLEGRNPSGSIKVRTACSLVADLHARGRLNPGSVLVESTSGNMGVALAFVCRRLGYGFVAVVDPGAPPELVERMRRLGAAVRVVTGADAHGNHLAARLRYVEERCRRDRRCVRVDQYSSPANPRVHYRDTGREIRQALPGVDAVFVAAGTGGTLAGVGRYFAEASPRTRVIGVDVPGSAVFGGARAPRRLSGIGSARPSSFLAPGLYHGHVVVAEAEAVALCRRLARDAGVCVGGSSGAALAACARWLRAHPEVRHPVCICPDGGGGYASTVYSDRWLRQVGIDPGAADLAWLTALRGTVERSAA